MKAFNALLAVAVLGAVTVGGQSSNDRNASPVRTRMCGDGKTAPAGWVVREQAPAGGGSACPGPGMSQWVIEQLPPTPESWSYLFGSEGSTLFRFKDGVIERCQEADLIFRCEQLRIAP